MTNFCLALGKLVRRSIFCCSCGAGPRLPGFAALADQLFDRYSEQSCQGWQRRDWHASAPDLVRIDRLLGDAERLGELHLGDAVFFA